MKLISQFFLIITALILLIWQVPQWYNFLTMKPINTPFALYSCVIGDFLSIGYDEEIGLIRRDQSGNNYTQEETDSILPTFYVRQLMADERFPKSIMGHPVTSREIQYTNFSYRVSASDINAPHIPLYFLMESKSGRVDLKMPDDVFRITKKGIEFVVMSDNSIDSEKSGKYTEKMKAAGFFFPARYIAGNPSTQKEYDEGFLILDNTGKLFHLKQVNGEPYIHNIPLPEGMEAKYLFVTEFQDRKMLGFITDSDNGFYVLHNGSYQIIKTGIQSYNPEKDELSIFGNMFDWTVCLERPDGDEYYALDSKSYSLIKSLKYDAADNSVKGLNFTSGLDKYVKPRF